MKTVVGRLKKIIQSMKKNKMKMKMSINNNDNTSFAADYIIANLIMLIDF